MRQTLYLCLVLSKVVQLLVSVPSGGGLENASHVLKITQFYKSHHDIPGLIDLIIHLDPDLAPGGHCEIPDDPGQEGEEGEAGERPDQGQAPGLGETSRVLGLDDQDIERPAQAGLKQACHCCL